MVTFSQKTYRYSNNVVFIKWYMGNDELLLVM